ncbi:hypothetical protein SDRG_06524 [Saprolegnia diclina VS20]|uniref:Uncharacterized protein n=1 Tax=Saprolegnia diclina (strain VS20) TaxID=1156394 RepID=T0QPI2_SAPDV|nr:hypothetical protein SDRG_06524 [Saprolegnia diclina VS20]EQC35765.1 hypothetical protein SDRG_06524 [Saprolegnia diclina VS20]|eukprot:XP_008610527.1 hypothetical protein SDRG_06524 [Saprolegnia diclina VS20]
MDSTSAWSGLELTLEECEILDVICPSTSSTSSESSDEQQRKRRHAAKLATQRTQRHRKKQQDELMYLKRKVDELQAQLKQLTVSQKALSAEPASKWEKLARDERKRQQVVSNENSRLKAAIEEQVQFAECLVEMIKKRPRLTLANEETRDQWKLLKLVAEPTARLEAIHAIADREYAKIDSVFIEAGIVDVGAGDRRRAMPVMLTNGDIEVQEITYGRFAVPLFIVAEAAWDVLRGAVELQAFPGHYTIVEDVDASTSYINALCLHELGNSQSRAIVKKYMESPSRCVIVVRSVMEDEAKPLDPAYEICDEVMWLSLDMDEAGVALGRFVQKARLRPGELGAGGVVPDYLMDAFTESTRTFENAIKTRIEKLMGGCCQPWTV